MRTLNSLMLGTLCVVAVGSTQAASKQLCVFDIMGSNGDMMAVKGLCASCQAVGCKY